MVVRADVAAGMIAGALGAVLISAIWIGLVFPPTIPIGGGGILKGDQIPLSEHDWGFNQFKKGGPEICGVTGHNITITLQNTGQNLHGFQVVADGGTFIAGLAKSDLLRPGEVRKISIHITQPGNYFYICPVSGHRQKGMVAPCVIQVGC